MQAGLGWQSPLLCASPDVAWHKFKLWSAVTLFTAMNCGQGRAMTCPRAWCYKSPMHLLWATVCTDEHTGNTATSSHQLHLVHDRAIVEPLGRTQKQHAIWQVMKTVRQALCVQNTSKADASQITHSTGVFPGLARGNTSV